MKYSILTKIVAPLLSLAAMQSQASAQCITPDGLDGGPCCTPASPNVPIPRQFRQEALSICWTDCDVESVMDCSAEWSLGSTNLSPCAVRNMTLRIRDGGGAVIWTGRIIVQYSRTWVESGPTGAPIQVWRYLANGDLRATAALGPDPCPMPPCAIPHGGRVKYTGYIDMAKPCQPAIGAPARQHAWMLTHACDFIDHQPGFPRGGVFHPDRSYTLVGPAAGFVPLPVQPIEAGTTVEDAVRRVDLSGGPPICLFEERMDCFVDPINEFCLCGPLTATPQFAVSELGISGACGTSVTSGGPYLPSFISMSIGTWTDPLTFPGVERLRWNAGGYNYVDPCVPAIRPEAFFGVTTMGGYPAQTVPSVAGTPSVPLLPTFVDQCNALRSGTTVMNVRWRKSDHFLNINLP